MESVTKRAVWKCQFRTRLFPQMGASGGFSCFVAAGTCRIRWGGGSRLGVAKHWRLHDESSFGQGKRWTESDSSYNGQQRVCSSRTLQGWGVHVENVSSRFQTSQMGRRSQSFLVQRFRKLAIRYEKTHASLLALHHLAAAIIALRKIGVIYG